MLYITVPSPFPKPSAIFPTAQLMKHSLRSFLQPHVISSPLPRNIPLKTPLSMFSVTLNLQLHCIVTEQTAPDKS